MLAVLLILATAGLILFVAALITALRWAVADREAGQFHVSTILLAMLTAGILFTVIALYSRVEWYEALSVSRREVYAADRMGLILLVLCAFAILRVVLIGPEGLCCERCLITFAVLAMSPLLWDWWHHTSEPEQRWLLVHELGFLGTWLLRHGRDIYEQEKTTRTPSQRHEALRRWLKDN